MCGEHATGQRFPVAFVASHAQRITPLASIAFGATFTMSPTSSSSQAPYDLLILGAGVIGLACAREIHRRHPSHRVALLDAPTGAMPASRAAAGMLAPFAEFAEDSALARWCAESFAAYPVFASELARETGLDIGLHHTGTLVPEGDDPENLHRNAQAWTRRGVAWRWLQGDDLRRAEPALAPTVRRAAWLPEAGLVSRQLHAALMASVRRTPMGFIEGTARRVLAEGHRVTGIELADGRVVPCRAVLAATGAWTSPVAELLDLRFRITPIKGQVARLAAPAGTLRHVIHTHGVYLAPWADQGIVMGSTMEDVGFDASVQEATIAAMRARAMAFVPAIAECPVAETWAGFRPKAVDRLPIVGWTARWANVMIATGHFRNGILLTPATARAVARLYENPNDHTWRAFSPERPGLVADAPASTTPRANH